MLQGRVLGVDEMQAIVGGLQFQRESGDFVLLLVDPVQVLGELAALLRVSLEHDRQ